MRLVCILTHGQGDMYPVLSVLPKIIEERGITDIKIYVDTVYNSNPSKFRVQLDGIKTMIERITTNWESVPYEFSGSDQWHGLPDCDRRTGPVYSKIKNDFLFYRLDRLKNYIRDRLRPDDIVIYGPCVWCYEWRNGENVPVDMAYKNWRMYKCQKVIDRGREFLSKQNIVIQARRKGGYDSYESYCQIGEYLDSVGRVPVYIGMREEMPAFDVGIDLRGKLDFDSCMWLMENAENAIVTASGLGYHRAGFGKNTVVVLPHSVGDPKYSFPHDVGAEAVRFVDCDSDIYSPIVDILNGWFK